MTKTADKAQLPAVQQSGTTQLSAEFADDIMALAGVGMAGVDREDLLMPRLGILQALSPQLNPRKPEYIEGAKPGMIFNTATGKLFDHIDVVAVAYQRRHIEWRRNRGGLVRDHGTDDSILRLCKDEPKQDRPNVILQITPDDNILTVTATWYILNLSDNASQGFIPMSSSQWKASRKWMTMATSERAEHPVHGVFQPPLFYRVYRLGTTLVTKGDDEWYVWTIDPQHTVLEIEGGKRLLSEARVLFDAVTSGEITAAAEAFGDAAEGEQRDGDAPQTF
jgi:hypothetical protein